MPRLVVVNLSKFDIHVAQLDADQAKHPPLLLPRQKAQALADDAAHGGIVWHWPDSRFRRRLGCASPAAMRRLGRRRLEWSAPFPIGDEAAAAIDVFMLKSRRKPFRRRRRRRRVARPAADAHTNSLSSEYSGGAERSWGRLIAVEEERLQGVTYVKFDEGPHEELFLKNEMDTRCTTDRRCALATHLATHHSLSPLTAHHSPSPLTAQGEGKRTRSRPERTSRTRSTTRSARSASRSRARRGPPRRARRRRRAAATAPPSSRGRRCASMRSRSLSTSPLGHRASDDDDADAGDAAGGGAVGQRAAADRGRPAMQSRPRHAGERRRRLGNPPGTRCGEGDDGAGVAAAAIAYRRPTAVPRDRRYAGHRRRRARTRRTRSTARRRR